MTGDRSPSPISREDFVILSTQDWKSLPTRKHRFARWWAESGNRVLYVEQQMHFAGWLVDIRNQFSRIWRWLEGPREVAPNLWVFTLPIVLPFFQMSGLINRINNLFLLPVLRAQLRRLGFEQPIVWTYTPHSADFIGKLGEKAAVYECVDDFTASKGLIDPKVIARLERRLIEAVDLFIATHPALAEKRKAWAKRSEVVPNGVEADHLARAADPDLPVAEAMAGLKHPVIGYLGGINYWIDTHLLARIAKENPDWTVAMVGPADLLADLEPLKGLSNVVMTGRVPYEEVPGCVKAFDVCVNPYVLDDVAEHCSPLKLYEYMATGKQIVSVDMPEARQFASLISIAGGADEFVELVSQAVHSPDGRDRERMAEARHHTWRGRFDAVSTALADVITRGVITTG
jgi:glycosyltransferase involved in cell wall biosynthesis